VVSEKVNSKSQYLRILKKWGLKKTLSEQDWINIDGRIRKRELERKDSDTYINGTLIPSTKLKKEISRHVRPSLIQEKNQGNQTARTPEGVTIRTPPAEYVRTIEIRNLPWFNFKHAAEPKCRSGFARGIKGF
jgi:hypothetical protein